jgi:hypothetical protein
VIDVRGVGNAGDIGSSIDKDILNPPGARDGPRFGNGGVRGHGYRG